MGEGERLEGQEQPAPAGIWPTPAPAGIWPTLGFALLWMLPLGALTAFAAIDALRQGAASTFRYVGF